MAETMAQHGRLGPMEWAAAARPVPGQVVCGDRSVAVGVGAHAALFGVIDGLGHGEPAAAAARCAEQVLRHADDRPLDDLMARCHREMTDTRGAAITLARVDFDAGHPAVGRASGTSSADLVARAPSGIDTRSSARLLGGIVGYRLPDIAAPEGLPVRPGHLLVMASDGLDENRLQELDFAAPADTLAEQILHRHGRANDDALVLVARHRGPSPMTAEFRAAYADALRAYLAGRDEATLEVGHELGRRALAERISTLDIVENHFRLLGAGDGGSEPAAALQFLLQTLATLDVATRGFLDGTQRYEQQRARADGLADRDQFRSALVNALQEGFFVADGDGAVVEINDAFTEITGYDAAGLPYRWPYPWLADQGLAARQLNQLIEAGDIQSETEIRRRDGAAGWAAVSINVVPAAGSAREAYVGTIRDVTVLRAAAERERLLARLATAIGLAKGMAEVLAITLDECRAAIDLQRVLTVTWQSGDDEPAVLAAGEPAGAGVVRPRPGPAGHPARRPAVAAADHRTGRRHLRRERRVRDRRDAARRR